MRSIVKKKLYILIRRDMQRNYQAVQAGHALAEWMLQNPTQAKEWDNRTLIYLSVSCEDALKAWGERLDKLEINWVGFREPDIGNELTAIATYGNGELYKELKLL